MGLCNSYKHKKTVGLKYEYFEKKKRFFKIILILEDSKHIFVKNIFICLILKYPDIRFYLRFGNTATCQKIVFENYSAYCKKLYTYEREY